MAPEWHHQRFTTDVVGAKKMEMYSYGLLCHWLLFDMLQDSANLNLDPDFETPLNSARHLTSVEAGFDDRQKRQVLRLFEITLTEDVDARGSDFGELLEILSPDEYDVLPFRPGVHIDEL